MEVDAVFECEKRSLVGQKPKTVHASNHCRPKVGERDTREKPRRSYRFKTLDCDFHEVSLCNSPSLYRRSVPSRPVGLSVEDNAVLKRGSVYQSSREVRKLNKLREGGRKIEPAHNGETFVSFEIVDSLSRHCKNATLSISQDKRLPALSLIEDLNSTFLDTSQMVQKNTPDFLDLSFRHLPEESMSVNSSSSNSVIARDGSSNGFLDICLLSEDTNRYRSKAVSKNVERAPVEDQKFKCSEIAVPENDGNVLAERDAIHLLPKSVSAKVEMLSSSSHLEDDAFKVSPKPRYNPLRKMFGPIMKSKSQRNPSLSEKENGSLATIDSLSIRRNKTLHRSLLNDFSRTAQKQKMENDRQIGTELVGGTASSPAHLHGILKLESKQGVPSFEFSMKDPEDVLSAKTWRTDNAFNWVYTFHSNNKKKSSSGWGSKERHKHFEPMVGQMQASCYLCSEVNKGSLDNFSILEFILYDLSQARRSFSSRGKSHSSTEANRPSNDTAAENFVPSSPMESNDSMETEQCKNHTRHGAKDCNSGVLASHPWAPTDLLPHFEIAAIVVQVPFRKKETLKDSLQGEICGKEHSGLSGTSVLDQGKDTISDSICPINVKAITPRGRHGLPSTEDGGPLPLLDRWRVGGGCDCGGWDMACPLVVLDIPNGRSAEDYSSRGSQQPFQLFFKGAKEKMPALTITADDDGQYSVDFHAQLSTLQAFSICVAILHSLEAFAVDGRETNRQRLHSSSLKLLLEEEVRHLIEAVTDEDKRKAKKRVEPIPAPYLLDPPFSPMGRV